LWTRESRDFSDANVPHFHFLVQKSREIYVVSRTDGEERRGLSQCGHFSDRGEGVNFSRFCADVLYGRLLTANSMLWPNCEINIIKNFKISKYILKRKGIPQVLCV